MTVRELEEKLGSSEEFTEWIAYFKILNEEMEKQRKKSAPPRR
jgi:hypothetical protein